MVLSDDTRKVKRGSIEPTMIKVSKWLFLAIIVAGVMIVSLSLRQQDTQAATVLSPPPPRTTEILVPFTEYQWWLTRWSDNQAVCGISIEHEGLPTAFEVLAACDTDLRDEWLATPPCEAALSETGNTSKCKGLYLHFADAYPRERTLVVDLPTPSVQLGLAGCTPTPPRNQCASIPPLVFEADEPLPNEIITSIHVQLNDTEYVCPGDYCEIPMSPTDEKGITVNFWATSTFGDETKKYTARVRILDAGVSGTGQSLWFVDVVSSQWDGGTVSSCGAAWEAFLPIGGMAPEWLTTPVEHTVLATDVGYAFLAGQMIQYNWVDASSCPQNGLLGNGAANPCGVELARPMVNAWQDQFDQTILQVAQDTSIPAQLMKNLFAQESQFWPGMILQNEFGLGQLTSQGADTPLLWNLDFFQQFCPLVLHDETCDEGYAQLEPDEQAMLRGALATTTNASCEDCALGIDLAHAEFSVDLFAKTLIGNCEQTSYIVYDVANQTPGVVSTYEDLWRFTLVNYNAGPGCLTTALQGAWRNSRELTWETVSDNVSSGCSSAITYVERVTAIRPIDVPDFLPSPTPDFGGLYGGAVTGTPGVSGYPAPGYPVETPTPGPTSAVSPTPTPLPTSTATPAGAYP